MDTIPDQRARQTLEKAIASGEFDRALGRGKLLQLPTDHPFVPSNHQLFFKVLKIANMAPDWIPLGRIPESSINNLHYQVNFYKERRQRLRKSSLTGRASDFKSVFQSTHKVHDHHHYEFEVRTEQAQRYVDRFNATAPDGAQHPAFRASTFLERFDQFWPWVSQDRSQ